MKNRTGCAVSGFAAGIINGFFGAGGGLVLVPALRKIAGQNARKAHATSVAIILPLCALSSAIYGSAHRLSLDTALPLIIGGVLSAPLGAYLLSKARQRILTRLFALFMIAAAVRMLAVG